MNAWDHIFQSIDYNRDLNNLPTVDINYGYGFADMPRSGQRDVLSNFYSAEVKYGFTRIDIGIQRTDLLYMANEYVHLTNFSTNLKPAFINETGTIHDNWAFGLGYRNGYGYSDDNEHKLVFFHSGSIEWTYMDIYRDKNVISDYSDLTRRLDERTRFGTSYESGGYFKITHTININASYKHSIVFHKFDFIKWGSGSLIELIIQRSIDYIGQDYLKSNQNNFPVSHFLLKSIVSFGIYELRRIHMYFPFESDPTMNFQSAKIGVTLLF